MNLEAGTTVTIIFDGEPIEARVTNVREGKHSVSYAISADADDGVFHSVMQASDEGVTWMRGHDPAICATLRAAYNLSDAKL